MYYLYSKNKGADQLHSYSARGVGQTADLCSYSAADLRLLFTHMQKAGFLMTRLIYIHVLLFKRPQTKPLWFAVAYLPI